MLQQQGNTYSKEELQEMIDKMQKLADQFYPLGHGTGNHAFGEFNGLMNEYINMCRGTLAAGGDFTQSNVHGGKPLVVEEFQATYLAEKFECIFGTTLRDEKFRSRFMMALGWDLVGRVGYDLKTGKKKVDEQRP